MNYQLFEYGIQNEESDIRIHIGVVTRRAFVFSTNAGRNAIKDKTRDQSVNTYTGKIVTAKGYPIPPDKIDDCLSILIPPDIFAEAKFSAGQWDEDTSTKGKRAIFVVREMLKRGLIPLNIQISEVTDKDIQISGTDISVTGLRNKIQVKCDWAAGPRYEGGTGNLFIQVAECNPYKMH